MWRKDATGPFLKAAKIYASFIDTGKRFSWVPPKKKVIQSKFYNKSQNQITV